MLDSEMTNAAILEGYAEALRHAGYDVTLTDVAVGRLARRGSVREAIVDAGGRLRLTETRQTRPEQSRRLTRLGARFRVLRETRVVTTVMVEAEHPEDLPKLLNEAEALLLEPPAKQR